MRITECRPFFIEYLSKPLQVSLLRNEKVRAITYSNQIEGNTLNEEQFSKLVAKKKKELNDTEVLEVQNYADVLDYGEKLAIHSRPLKISDFCDIQRPIPDGLIRKGQLGRLRKIPVSIVNTTTGDIIGSCPESHNLKDAMEELWKWLDDTGEVNPFLRSLFYLFILKIFHSFTQVKIKIVYIS